MQGLEVTCEDHRATCVHLIIVLFSSCLTAGGRIFSFTEQLLVMSSAHRIVTHNLPASPLFQVVCTEENPVDNTNVR